MHEACTEASTRLCPHLKVRGFAMSEVHSMRAQMRYSVCGRCTSTGSSNSCWHAGLHVISARAVDGDVGCHEAFASAATPCGSLRLAGYKSAGDGMAAAVFAVGRRQRATRPSHSGSLGTFAGRRPDAAEDAGRPGRGDRERPVRRYRPAAELDLRALGRA